MSNCLFLVAYISQLPVLWWPVKSKPSFNSHPYSLSVYFETWLFCFAIFCWMMYSWASFMRKGTSVRRAFSILPNSTFELFISGLIRATFALYRSLFHDGLYTQESLSIILYEKSIIVLLIFTPFISHKRRVALNTKVASQCSRSATLFYCRQVLLLAAHALRASLETTDRSANIIKCSN